MPILHVEFHHMTGSGKDVKKEIFERYQDDIPLLRAGVIDRIGTCTVLRMKIDNQVLASLEALKKINASKEEEKLREFFRVDKYLQLSEDYRKELLTFRQYVSFRLRQIVSNNDLIMIKKFDDTFRPVEGREVLDLLPGIMRDRGLWIFVYGGDDLVKPDGGMLFFMRA